MLGAEGSNNRIIVGAGLSSRVTTYNIEVYRHQPPVQVSIVEAFRAEFLEEGGVGDGDAVVRIRFKLERAIERNLELKIVLEAGSLSMEDLVFARGRDVNIIGVEGNTVTYLLESHDNMKQPPPILEPTILVRAVPDGVVEMEESSFFVIAPSSDSSYGIGSKPNIRLRVND